MATPNKIKFHGATYVKVEAATKHKRCATGTHTLAVKKEKDPEQKAEEIHDEIMNKIDEILRKHGIRMHGRDEGILSRAVSDLVGYEGYGE